MACTLTDVIACVPLEGSEVDLVPADCLNQLLNLIAQLRGGGSRFLPLLLAKVSENLPLMAPTPTPLPRIHVKQEGSATSPTESSHSAPLMRPSPVSPASLGVLTPSFTDPMPGGPISQRSSEGLSMSPWTPKPEMLAPGKFPLLGIIQDNFSTVCQDRRPLERLLILGNFGTSLYQGNHR